MGRYNKNPPASFETSECPRYHSNCTGFGPVPLSELCQALRCDAAGRGELLLSGARAPPFRSRLGSDSHTTPCRPLSTAADSLVAGPVVRSLRQSLCDGTDCSTYREECQEGFLIFLLKRQARKCFRACLTVKSFSFLIPASADTARGTRGPSPDRGRCSRCSCRCSNTSRPRRLMRRRPCLP